MEIDGPTNQALALWAADCAERVLNLFEAERPQDDRPRKAINAARAWQLGMINVTEARATAFAAHAAARETTTSGSRAAARAARARRFVVCFKTDPLLDLSGGEHEGAAGSPA